MIAPDRENGGHGAVNCARFLAIYSVREEAESEAAVLRLLEEKNLFPITLGGAKAKTSARSTFGRKVRSRDVGLMYGQLADLIGSGVPLLRALDFMQAQPVEVKNLIQKRLGVSEMDIVDQIYGLVTKYATRNGIASQKAIENTLLGTPFEGKLTNFAKLTDFSVAREVAEGK